jgi:hypothetical protein
MEELSIIFKAGVDFVKACKEYLLIQKVDELNREIDLIKGSFFSNAMDFVKKASLCENENNIRFFLESAYSNFSQSSKMYLNSTKKLYTTSLFQIFKESIADSLKLRGTNSASRKYNSVVDKYKEKAIREDKTKAVNVYKECERLEMSYLGKAMCEFNMREYVLCTESLDSAAGVFGVLLSFIKGRISNNIINDTERDIERMLVDVFAETFINLDYYRIINRLSSEYHIPIDSLPNRRMVLQALHNNNGIHSQLLLDTILYESRE